MISAEFCLMYDIQLFGRLEVRTRGVCLVGSDFGGVGPRHTLALLALHGVLRTEELTELLWDGRPPADHQQYVRDYISVLRHRLDPTASEVDSVIAQGDDGYVLVADRVRVDVARFDELVGVARGRTARRALPPLTAAAHLAGRPVLADEHATWAQAARRRYRVRLLEVLLETAGYALTAGRPLEALGLAERAVGLDPLTQRGWRIANAARRAFSDPVSTPAVTREPGPVGTGGRLPLSRAADLVS